LYVKLDRVRGGAFINFTHTHTQRMLNKLIVKINFIVISVRNVAWGPIYTQESHENDCSEIEHQPQTKNYQKCFLDRTSNQETKPNSLHHAL